MAVIHSLKNTASILMGDFAVIHPLSNYSSSGMFISKTKLALVTGSFRGTTIISIEDLQPSILSMVLYIFFKFEAIRFRQRAFFQLISEH